LEAGTLAIEVSKCAPLKRAAKWEPSAFQQQADNVRPVFDRFRRTDTAGSFPADDGTGLHQNGSDWGAALCKASPRFSKAGLGFAALQ